VLYIGREERRGARIFEECDRIERREERKVEITSEAGNDVFLFIELLIDPCRHNLDTGVSILHRSKTFGAGNEVEEDDSFLRDSVVEENFNRFDCGSTSSCT